jgi:hypothetical protein
LRDWVDKVARGEPLIKTEGDPRQENDFIPRLIWGTSGFILFIVGAIMSRPSETQALAAALDTTGNVLTAPVKAAKGAADTAGIFSVALAGGKPAAKPQPKGDGPKQLPPPPPPPKPIGSSPTPGGIGPVDAAVEFVEKQSGMAEGRRQNAIKASKKAAEKRTEKARTVGIGNAIGKWFAQDMAKPSPAEALTNPKPKTKTPKSGGKKNTFRGVPYKPSKDDLTPTLFDPDGDLPAFEPPKQSQPNMVKAEQKFRPSKQDEATVEKALMKGMKVKKIPKPRT